MFLTRVVYLLSILVALGGAVVIFGWAAGIPVLTSISPNWVTMKFSTALCFLLSGTMLFLIERTKRPSAELAELMLPIVVAGIFLLMGVMLVSAILGVESGVEELFIEESLDAVDTTVPGRPSVATMVSFIGMGVAGALAISGIVAWRRFIGTIGWLITGIAVLAVIGYLLDSDLFVYHVEGYSSAMAIHTGLLFALCGIALVVASHDAKGEDGETTQQHKL